MKLPILTVKKLIPRKKWFSQSHQKFIGRAETGSLILHQTVQQAYKVRDKREREKRKLKATLIPHCCLTHFSQLLLWLYLNPRKAESRSNKEPRHSGKQMLHLVPSSATWYTRWIMEPCWPIHANKSLKLSCFGIKGGLSASFISEP